MRIAKEGYPIVGAGAVVAVIAFLFSPALGVLLLLADLAIAAFFRDPERVTPQGENLIISPADGRVVSIAEAEDNSPLAGAATRISIFLSPLDVHINRMPVSGTVEKTEYQRGKYLAAYKDESSSRNERNALHIVENGGRKLVVVQVAGVVARRIICRVRSGSRVQRGDRFGLIMFGSRTDTYLPAGCRIDVAEGQKVRGGETILGAL